MADANPDDFKKFFEGLKVFIELCGKHPDIAEEFIRKLKAAEETKKNLNELEKLIEEEAERRIDKLRKEGKLVKMKQVPPGREDLYLSRLNQ